MLDLPRHGDEEDPTTGGTGTGLWRNSKENTTSETKDLDDGKRKHQKMYKRYLCRRHSKDSFLRTLD